MFDMIEIGKRLSRLRRNANLTQMEVAERLGISFQAVSYWERGKSLPDISNLVMIAELYHASIDEILDNERQSRAVHNFVSDKKVSDLLEIISIMKPEEIITAIENSKINVTEFEQIYDAAPYLDEEILSSLAIKYSDKVLYFSQICRIACYISRYALDVIALDNSDKVLSFSQVCEIACRMSKNSISRLSQENSKKVEAFSQICNIAVFIDLPSLCRLVADNENKVEQFSQICNIACFINKETVSRLAYLHSHKVESFSQIHNLACYLDNKALAKLALIDSVEQERNICFYLDGEARQEFYKRAEEQLNKHRT
jgi:transcriptional regulator with XRE-family HTH domain